MDTILKIAIGGIGAAAISGYLLRALKISEFRQIWINELRSDIAEYVAYCINWRLELERLTEKRNEEYRLHSIEVDKLKLQALTLQLKIKLRINPEDNENKKEDDEFLKALENVLGDPIHKAIKAPISEIEEMGDICIAHARHLIKREWETTKNPWLKLIQIIKEVSGKTYSLIMIVSLIMIISIYSSLFDASANTNIYIKVIFVLSAISTWSSCAVIGKNINIEMTKYYNQLSLICSLAILFFAIFAL